MRDESYSCGGGFLLIYKDLVFQAETEIVKKKERKKLRLEKQKKMLSRE